MSSAAKIQAILQESSSPSFTSKLQAYMDSLVTSDNLVDFDSSISKLIESAIIPSIISKVVEGNLKLVPSQKSPGDRVGFYRSIARLFANLPGMRALFADYEKRFFEDCNNSDNFVEIAKYLDSKPLNHDESEDELLEYYLTIADAYVKADQFSLGNTRLNQAREHRFTQRSKKDLLDRYNVLYAEILISQSNYDKAAQTFLEISQTSQSKEIQLSALHRAVIYTIMSPPGSLKRRIFANISEDQRSTTIPIFHILERMSQNQLIGPEEVTEIWNELKNEKGMNEESLRNTMRMHNLGEIGLLFSSISLKRIAEIIGSNEKEALTIIGLMIGQGRLKAQIDQTENLLIFRQEEAHPSDSEIAKFCETVSSVAKSIKA